jgi:hypothetical protein
MNPPDPAFGVKFAKRDDAAGILLRRLRELRNRGMTLLNHLAPLKRLLTARALDA